MGIRDRAEAAVENFVAMRAAEGEKLRADILSRLVLSLIHI